MPHPKSATLFARVAVAVVAPLACQRSSDVSRPAEAPTSRPVPVAGVAASSQHIRDRDGDPLPRRPDGHVVRVPEAAALVINLGVGDTVSQGMTFEVYDSHAGLPAAGVAGKATVEVVRMMPGYSECRVIRRIPGVGVNIGDLVVKHSPAARPVE